jgi:hypothetical protein
MSQISYRELRRLVEQSPNPSEGLIEWLAATDAIAWETPGRLPARSVLADFRVRQKSAERAGMVVKGLEDLLHVLTTTPPSQTVYLFNSRTPDRIYGVFVSGARVLGGIAYSRRHAKK